VISIHYFRYKIFEFCFIPEEFISYLKFHTILSIKFPSHSNNTKEHLIAKWMFESASVYHTGYWIQTCHITIYYITLCYIQRSANDYVWYETGKLP